MCAVVLPGDWRRANFYATALSCWNLLPQVRGLCGPDMHLSHVPMHEETHQSHQPVVGSLLQKEAVLAMLRQKLQEEGLRTYLLSYGRFYSSLSIVQLCDMFELPKAKV